MKDLKASANVAGGCISRQEVMEQVVFTQCVHQSVIDIEAEVGLVGDLQLQKPNEEAK